MLKNLNNSVCAKSLGVLIQLTITSESAKLGIVWCRFIRGFHGNVPSSDNNT